jgi:hypothetical protein
VMCRAEDPAARRLTPRISVRHRSGRIVLLESTCFDVVKSHVRNVWSHDAEYPTVASCNLNIAADATSVWPSIKDRGPRCGACEVSDFDRFRRLLAAVDADGRREAGASGAEVAEVDQRPILWSLDAERIREVVALTSIDSTPDLWP